MRNNSIAVIIPVYNVKNYLDLCIKSVINQSVIPDEIILIDDGSTDQSGIMCDKYSQKYKNIRVIHQQNQGLSAARNTGINNINSRYFVLLDSDDTLENNCIENFKNIIKNKQVEIVVGGVLSHWPDKIVKKCHSNNDSSKIIDGREFLKSELKNKTMFYESVQSMYDKDFIVKNNLFFEKGLLHEDQLFTIKVLLLAKKVLPSDIVFYNHMIRENSISTQKDQTPNARSIIDICYKVENLVKSVDDLKLKKMIMDHCVALYYKVYYDAELINKPKIRINIEFLRRYSFSKKNIFRTTLYRISERLFYTFERIRKKG